MKLKTIVIVLGVILLLFFFFKVGMFFLKKKFLQDVDFSKGTYAIILNDQVPAILVDDQTVLEQNKDKIKIAVSWLSSLSGEGENPKGVYLFMDENLVKSKTARKFSDFNAGNIRESGKPIERKSLQGSRTHIIKKEDSLRDSNVSYIISNDIPDSDGFEYIFKVVCPSLMISRNDNTFKELDFGKDLVASIQNKFKEFKGFKLEDQAWRGSTSEAILVENIANQTSYLKDDNNAILKIPGYTIHQYTLNFKCTKEFYEQIKTQDFGVFFKTEGLSIPEIQKLKLKHLNNATNGINVDNVNILMYEEHFVIGALQEVKYTIDYFELID